MTLAAEPSPGLSPAKAVATPSMSEIRVPDSVRAILTPPEDLTVSAWCDRYRMLHEMDCAEPGPWRTSRVPYMREILDSFADPSVGTITFIKCSRISGTEFLNNCLAYSVDHRPMPVLYVLPTESDVNDEFAGRIRRIFEASPRLSTHRTGEGWATVDQLSLDTMVIRGGWASAPGTLIRVTAGVVVFDEIDNCEAAAGRMGNTLQVVQDRVTTYGYRSKVLINTTPTVSTAAGWTKYQASDRRQYYVPCPHCGTYQTLVFERIKIVPAGERNPDKIELEGLAGYECGACQQVIDHKRQGWMVARGVWVPAAQKVEEVLPLDQPDVVERAASMGSDRWSPSLAGPAPRTRNRGYWINSLYSPWRTWPQIVAEFLRVKDDPERLRVFKNSWLAQVWEETVETVRLEVLRAKVAVGAPRDVVPPRARMILCAADVQGDHMPYIIRAWGPNRESWKIREGRAETFDELYRIAFETGFPWSPADGSPPGKMLCTSLAVDSGFRTDEVYEFGKRPGVVVVKGRDVADFRTKPSRVEYYGKGQLRPDSLVVYHVNTSLFKTTAHRLANANVQAGDSGVDSTAVSGGWHLDADTSDEYLNQFTAEHQVFKRGKGRKAKRTLVWEPRSDGLPNHYLDCEVYGLALADLLNVFLLRDDYAPPLLAMHDPVAVAAAAPAPPPRRRGWVRRDRSDA